MLPTVSIGRHSGTVPTRIQGDPALVGSGFVDDVISPGRSVSGLRICNINSTPYGGGVAELLSCVASYG
jgi:hypothetical protein